MQPSNQLSYQGNWKLLIAQAKKMLFCSVIWGK